MNASHSTILGLIQVSGPDAEKFLQGQLTCDVNALSAINTYITGAHCDPKGRVQATFRLFKRQTDFYFLLPVSTIPILRECLQKYAVFSKVKLEELLESEHLTDFKTTVWPALQMEDWQLQDIYTGVATIFPETSGQFTPHQLNYQLIDGINFNKGCYIGQQIVARMHYLGKLKQQTFRVSFTHTNILPPGTVVYNNQAQPIGTLLMAAAATQHDIARPLPSDATQSNYEALVVLQNNAVQENMYLSAHQDNIIALLDLPYAL